MAKLTDEELRKAAHEAVDAVADAVGPAAKKARKAANDTAKKVSSAIKPEIILQYDGKETNAADLVAAAKDAFHAERGRVAIMSCKIYLKPQDNAAYYVINDDYVGKLDL